MSWESAEEHVRDIHNILDECFFGPWVSHKSSITWWEEERLFLARFDGNIREFKKKHEAMMWLGAVWQIASNREKYAPPTTPEDE